MPMELIMRSQYGPIPTVARIYSYMCDPCPVYIHGFVLGVNLTFQSYFFGGFF